MGKYLNPGNAGFEAICRDRYVDKSELIAYTNAKLGTSHKLMCISRPRRFGKSFAAKMLCAYYDSSCNSSSLFCDLKIAQNETYLKYMNCYDVLYLDITWFIANSNEIKDTVKNLQREVIKELKESYQSLDISLDTTLSMALAEWSEHTGKKFIVIIDEWDALFREAKEEMDLQAEYLKLLRSLFKSSMTDKMIELAYMTGILPIKKYGTQSALTDFDEFTMLDSAPLEKFVGFTEEEVRSLCQEYGNVDFQEIENWYDGYLAEQMHIYSPKSVMDAVIKGRYGNYWTQTETYESLKLYINMNFDGLKDGIVRLLAGQRYRIMTRKFQNDMTNMNSKDDVFTLLIHLGYLAFDSATSEVYIPNQEIAGEFENVIEEDGWTMIANTIHESEQLLKNTLDGNEEAVAQSIDAVHEANTSILSYNDENSLSCVITLAYYCARKEYILLRELPTGKGFADIVFIPRRTSKLPAMIIELKWDKSATGAIQQIKDKSYTGALSDYIGDFLLVGINYDKKSKKHECIIQRGKGA